MATLDYKKRLSNLQTRKFSQMLNESALSNSFEKADIPGNVKYFYESMRAIDAKYNAKTIEAANRVQSHLEEGLRLHFGRDYRTQGSIKTETNIKVYSDFDLLTIIARYVYLHPEVVNDSPYNESDPKLDIEQLREQSTTILKQKYDDVDTSGAKSIAIVNKALNRKVDVVFAYWYETNEYRNTHEEYYRGVQLFDFTTRTRITDYPFAHIANVNYKGNSTNNGSKRGIRLLKNLKADADQPIDLSSFQLTTIVHSVEDENVKYAGPGSELSIAKSISRQMNTVIEIPTYRKQIKSPNGTEFPLSNDKCVAEMKRLKEDLDTLIEDTEREMHSIVLTKALMTY